MKKILFLILAVLCIAFLCACGNGTPVNDGSALTSQAETEPKQIKIKTPYCDICVPNEFEGNVKNSVVSESPYTLSFSAASDGTELFSLVFDGKADTVLGTLKLADKNVVVSVISVEIDNESENYDTYCAYQEGINTIREHLSADYDFVVGESVPYEDTSVFDIVTPVVTMQYPEKWQDKVTVNITDEAVKFSSDGAGLFDICFTECDGYLLGTYIDTPIYLVDYDIDESKYSDEEYIDFCAMKEDVNVILQHLMEDQNFNTAQ